jgi:hypothetical protein
VQITQRFDEHWLDCGTCTRFGWKVTYVLLGLGGIIESARNMHARPDRPLVVKCAFDRWNKRISFASARNCSYELLRNRVRLFGHVLTLKAYHPYCLA